MLAVGLTGGIGSGKSTALELFGEAGAKIVRTDDIAHAVIQPGHAGYNAVVQAFGDEILNGDNTINRKALGQVVFANSFMRAKLEAIIHPLVRSVVHDVLAACEASDEIVIVEIPLLVETDQDYAFDLVLVVDVAPEAATNRLMSGRAFTRDEALARINVQANRDSRLAAADIVIDNSGNLADLRKQIAGIWLQLQQRNAESSR